MENVVLITGATSGFGEACAHIFAENGWNLIITGRRTERLEKIKSKLIELYSCKVLTLNFDVCIEKDVKTAIESIPVDFKKSIKILINNAGLAVGRGPIQDGSRNPVSGDH